MSVFRMLLTLGVLTVLDGPGMAQEGLASPPPPEGSPPSDGRRGDKGPHGPPPMHRKDGPGRDREGRERGDFFQKLSEEERRRVREAFDKVWGRPEVEAARERLRVANDDYRKAVHEALTAVDPEAVAILDRMRPKPPPMPDVKDEGFAEKALGRLRFEGPGSGEPFGGRGPREGGGLHEEILRNPEVAALVKQLKDAPPEARLEIWEQLRKVYQKAAQERRR